MANYKYDEYNVIYVTSRSYFCKIISPQIICLKVSLKEAFRHKIYLEFS